MTSTCRQACTEQAQEKCRLLNLIIKLKKKEEEKNGKKKGKAKKNKQEHTETLARKQKRGRLSARTNGRRFVFACQMRTQKSGREREREREKWPKNCSTKCKRDHTVRVQLGRLPFLAF